jgi:hypothetical protein
VRLKIKLLRGVDDHNAGLEAQNRAQNGALEELMVADSLHFDEEQDPKPNTYPHYNEKLVLASIKVNKYYMSHKF